MRHTDPSFKNLGILNLESIHKPQIGKIMYQYKSGLLPDSFNNMFLVTRQVHSYDERSSGFFKLIYHNYNNKRKFSISFQNIPNSSTVCFVLNATNTASFCCKPKAFLLP